MFTNAGRDKNGESVFLPLCRRKGNEGQRPQAEWGSCEKRCQGPAPPVYRPSKLSQDLQQADACSLLEERGYTFGVPERCIIHIMQRLADGREFPHEIGLFLGYPPKDVCGFIENRAGGYKYVGEWKVYGDADKAKEIFARYRKCTEVYCAQFAQGKSIERLTVAV